ncbi:MAG: MFS transporter [Pseudomonadota bacterium]
MFFGWRVVAGSFIAMMVVTGFFTYTFTLFVTPLREEFGVGLEQVMYSLTLGTLMGLVISPAMGVLIDKLPIRLLMIAGSIVLALGFFSMSQVSSILAFNVIFGLAFSLGNASVGAMAGSAVVSRWFVRNRGRALGITTIGTSVGGMLLPALTAYWIAESGWRAAMQNLSYIALALIPWLWLNVRGRPEELGLQPDGDPGDAPHGDRPEPARNPETETTPAQEDSMGMKTIIQQREFWLIGVSMGLLIAAFTSTLSNLSPYAVDLGASQTQASNLIMLIAITGLIGKILFGLGADKFSLKWGLWAAQGLVGIAFLIMAQEPPYAILLIAAICIGLATGGLLPVWNAMMAQVFGVNSFGRAMGAMGPVITLLIMPTYILVGRLYDLNGNYVATLFLFTGVSVLAALLLIPVRLPQQTH